MPTKRERGKQRKAKKNLAASNGGTTSSNGGVRVGSSVSTRELVNGRYQNVEEITMTRSDVVVLAQKGNNMATELLLSDSLVDISFELIHVLPHVLACLKKCENDFFDKVLLDVGGDLKSPSIWIRLLSRATSLEPGCYIQVVENIGPLVSCMCNDTKRQLFKSSKHWRESIHPFVDLIFNLIKIIVNKLSEGPPDMVILENILQNEELVQSIVQWAFLGEEEHHTDIVNELNSISVDACSILANCCHAITKVLVLTSQKMLQQNMTNGRSIMNDIGSTPIIKNSSCTISCVEGLIRRMKTDDRWRGGQYAIPQTLIEIADCVDKGVITEVIDFGLNHEPNIHVALAASIMSHFMIMKGTTDVGSLFPSDTRIAFAIRDGYFELLLNCIRGFGGCLDAKVEQLLDVIGEIFKSVHVVSLHQKTAKAIRSKKRDIEKQLLSLEGNTSITNNTKCEMLLNMARSILDLNGSYCCRCNKSLTKTEVKLCNGCGCMAYCSKACQKKDWINGHELTCCKTYTDETAGHFQGRVWPIEAPNEWNPSKLNDLVINVNMIQLKLFLDNSENIVTQARALGIPLCDLVVKFELSHCPNLVEKGASVVVVSYIDYFNTPESKKSFEDSRSTENITCSYVSHYYDSSENSSRLVIQHRIFDFSWLLEEKGMSEKLDWVDILQTL